MFETVLPETEFGPFLSHGSRSQKIFRYLLRFYSLLFRGFFVVFSWLFRGPLLSRKAVFGPFSLLFRGFFVAPVLGKFYAYSPWNSLLTVVRAFGWRTSAQKTLSLQFPALQAMGRKFLARGVRPDIRLDVHGISRPKTFSLGCPVL